MAIIRKDLTSSLTPCTYEGLVEAAADLLTDETEQWAAGSMAYCLEDSRIYVKRTDGTWKAEGA